MAFTLQPAVRSSTKPLVGFYGKSGSGKTLSALLFARGLVGPQGKIVLVDSENLRGSIFADIVPGGYSVINFDPPFRPERYAEAIATAEAGADCVIVDSLTHEWSGEGGVLDWADEELERMGGGDQNKMRSWIKPKMAHKLMISRLLRCKVPLICCLRGEEKTHIEKNEKGKSIVVTDDFSSPLFDPRFIFEMLLNFETLAHAGIGGYVIPRKVTHPSIAALLPGPEQQITVAHGAALAAWCKSPGTAAPTPAPAATSLKAMKAELWELTRTIHGGEIAKLESWLADNHILPAGLKLADLREADISETIQRSKIAMKEQTP